MRALRAAVVLLLGASPASAQGTCPPPSSTATGSTRSISAVGHMAIVRDQICAIENAGTLACHPASSAGTWSEITGETLQPRSALQPQTGIVRVDPTPAVGGGRSLVLTQRQLIWVRLFSGEREWRVVDHLTRRSLDLGGGNGSGILASS